ncbi:MAG: C_GCAxxG_C_C family protein [Elusimicrobia bacterium]|nr:C_GCAxxG_C_C family protein [Elusimicrobiota bacterium]
MTKVEQAQKNFRNGYNCCQSVFAAFCQDFGIDLEIGLKLTSAFGGGMGGLGQVCGTVTAMFMIAGLKYGYTDSQDKMLKMKHYKQIQNLAKDFSDKFGSILCKELLKTNSTVKTEPGVRPCERFVLYATEMMEKL